MTSSLRSSRRPCLHVAGKRQAEVGVERALVELVEHHGGDAHERGIVENETGEYALGHDFDPGRARDLGGETDAVADGHADRLAQCRRHARGGGTGGEPARRKHEDFLSPAQASPASTSGTRVVLPAPGGATRTATFRRAQSASQLRQRGIDRKRLCELVHQGTLLTSPVREHAWKTSA